MLLPVLVALARLSMLPVIFVFSLPVALISVLTISRNGDTET
jgi:hypothetical protein